MDTNRGSGQTGLLSDYSQPLVAREAGAGVPEDTDLFQPNKELLLQMNSYEDILYELSYYGDDAEVESYLVKVIDQLPQDVASYALEHCSFLSTGRATSGMVLPGIVAKPEHLYGLELATQSARGQGNLSELRQYQAAARKLDSAAMWLVLLDERIADEGEDEAMGVIAHEIAHVWLKHNRLEDTSAPECEIEAANLTKTWGFNGRGAEADFCYSPFRTCAP